LAHPEPSGTADSEHVNTERHHLTTTVYAVSGLVPICQCGWKPNRFLHSEQDVVLALIEHNEAFLRDDCPQCGAALATVPTSWNVDLDMFDRHFTDKRCAACGWSASHCPE
jgi:hypothetical protein